MFPDVPMFHVREGDVVVMRIVNDSGDVHPMHLHGHHVVVLSRDGVAASGSPWWVDSLDVHPGESYDIAFVADNPGIWSDHCHTLPHAVDGLVAHVMYEGVTTPFTINGDAGQPARVMRGRGIRKNHRPRCVAIKHESDRVLADRRFVRPEPRGA